MEDLAILAVLAMPIIPYQTFVGRFLPYDPQQQPSVAKSVIVNFIGVSLSILLLPITVSFSIIIGVPTFVMYKLNK